MPMKMGWRWYGEGNDPITLNDIKQIPGVTSIVWALHNKMPGEIWEIDEIQKVADQIHAYGFDMDVVESVNVHDDIKIGLPTRDKYIENYKQCIRNLSKFGVKVICYNFMPVFDWTRTEMAKVLPDGSTTLAFDAKEVAKIDPEKGISLPGWDASYKPEELKALLNEYMSVNEDKLWENFEYFLKKIIPVAEEVGVKMACHPDDPPRPIFGLPRIVKNRNDLARLVSVIDSPSNGLTLCTGSLGADLGNDIVSLVREFGGRQKIHFTHIRNVKTEADGTFHESMHLSRDGSLDMAAIVKAYCDTGFTGYWRPDHGRMIWGETGKPGYGLYDRALGATYVNGMYEAICKYGKA